MKAKIVFAFVAFIGVVAASVYVLRVLIRTMHNRVGPRVVSRDIGLADAAVLVPLVATILFFALYPQLALHRQEGTVKQSIVNARAALATRDGTTTSASAEHGLSPSIAP